MSKVLEWLGKQNKWYVLLVAVLVVVTLYVFNVELSDAWKALTGQ